MRFVSRKKELVLVIRPTEVVMDANRRPMIMRGEKVEFHQGVYNTDNPSLIDYLIHRKDYGINFTSEIGNDPVQIQKHSLIFDDGAELTGPKVVAGYPERNRPPAIQMVRGANSTVENPVKAKEDATIVPPVAKPIPKLVTTEDVEAIIDKKFDAFLEKLGNLAIQPQIKNSKRSYKCPMCDEVFPSGFACGAHKKEKHSN